MARRALGEPTARAPGLMSLAGEAPHYDFPGARELRGRHVLGVGMAAPAVEARMRWALDRHTL